MKARVRRTPKSLDHNQLSDDTDFFPHADWVLGQSSAIHRVASHVKRAAETDCTVLVCGETGTGKELWANLIHQLGSRAEKPFVPVNCAALTPTLAESQLFGHEKGAFTGASGPSLGVFRAADEGVVFLDEVGDMPWELQPKLLRVVQEQEVTPVGSAHPVNVDVQIIAATNRDLDTEVSEGRFREDLYFRLTMCVLRIPALRDRSEDIPAFIEHFSARFAEKYGLPEWMPDAETFREFCEYSWPGNIRQLAHIIEQSYVLDSAPSLPQLDAREFDSSLPFFNLSRLRRAALQQALRATRGHKGRAARLLGVHANTLTRMLAALKATEDQSTEIRR